MQNRYIRVRYGTNGKSKLISFEIPGIWLEILVVEGLPVEAFGVKDQCLEAIIIGAKKGIEIEIQRVSRTIDHDKKIKDLEAALVHIDELLTQGGSTLAVRRFGQAA